MDIFTSIYDQFWKATVSAQPSDVGFFGANNSHHLSCPECGTSTLAEFAEDYLEQDLVMSGIAIELPDGLVMNPALVGRNNNVVLLADCEDRRIYGFLTSVGMIPETSIPVLAGLQDCQTLVSLVANANSLYVAFSLEDVMWLQNWGFAATLAFGLEKLRIEQFQELYRACHWNENVADLFSDSKPEKLEASACTPTIKGPVDLVLVGWSPARMLTAEPVELHLVAARLLATEKYVDADLSRISIWRPSRDDLERVTFLRAAGTPHDVFWALNESATTSRFLLSQSLESVEATRIPPSYQEALLDLKELLEAPVGLRSGRQIAKTHAAFKRAVETHFVQPLSDVGTASGDPIQNSLSLLSADLARVLHLRLPFLSHAEQASSESLSPGLLAAKATSDPESLCKIADRFLKCVRELRQ